MLGYEPDRNFPGTAGPYLSAALSVGTLSPRQVWCAAQDSRGQARSEEQLHAIAVWEQELGWREFYQQALFHFRNWPMAPTASSAASPGRTTANGSTSGGADRHADHRRGDASVNQTGWMHNRCRMIVASYLVKDLICDWRWGERAFMELEVDGDLAANNGGWQWSASSGMDPKPLRIFNPATQASKFDSAGDYIRRWVPELRHVNTKDLLSGDIGALGGGLPEPLVDHEQQANSRRSTPPSGLIAFVAAAELGWCVGHQQLTHGVDHSLLLVFFNSGRSAGSAPGCRAVR